MKPVADETRRIWAMAGAVALGVGLLVVALFRAPPPPPASVKRLPLPGNVKLARLGETGDELLREQADLYDPTPLFLPTPWNARANDLPIDAVRGPSGVFQGYPAKPTFAEDSAKPAFPATIEVPVRPVDALAIGPPEMPFAGIGRSDRVLPMLSSRDAFMEVVVAATGQSAMELTLKNVRLPAGADWWPLEFLVTVDHAGLVGAPRLTASSRVELVDLHFSKYLVEELRLGGRLAPGFYRIKIGP